MPAPEAPAQAQSWPARPIRLVVAFPPGGSGDFIARNMSEEIPFWAKSSGNPAPRRIDRPRLIAVTGER